MKTHPTDQKVPNFSQRSFVIDALRNDFFLQSLSTCFYINLTNELRNKLNANNAASLGL